MKKMKKRGRKKMREIWCAVEEKTKDRSLKEDDHSLNLEHVKEEIEAIKTEMMGIYDTGLEAILQVGSCSTSGDSDSSKSNTKTWGVGEEEIMVGFEDEAMSLKKQLTRGPMQLQVISIVGMAGQGKTTLATKLYADPLVVYHFHIRAWTSVFQEYRNRDLLIRLLSCVMKHTNGIDQMGDEKLCEKLHKSLKGRTYFIVMDDIWDTKAWLI
ncbi:putative late blight resistance protein homolog R1A-3 [Camellia sinensis]|nr:putative late blight resistance protein homolog R1A-3 [Camellia sinensis]